MLELTPPGQLVAVYDRHAPPGHMPPSTKVLMEIIDVLQRERDTYRAYVGQILSNPPLKRQLAVNHGMLEQYTVTAADAFIPDGKVAGDIAFRFTALGIAAVETV